MNMRFNIAVSKWLVFLQNGFFVKESLFIFILAIRWDIISRESFLWGGLLSLRWMGQWCCVLREVLFEYTPKGSCIESLKVELTGIFASGGVAKKEFCNNFL